MKAFLVHKDDELIFEVKKLLNERMLKAYAELNTTKNGYTYYGLINGIPEYTDDSSVEKITGTEAIKLLKGKSRCCGRCDGVNDICVADDVCDKHNVEGCEICFGLRSKEWQPKVGDEVEYDSKKARYIGKSVLANDNSIIIEIETSKYSSKVLYCDPSHLRPIQPPTVREKVKNYINIEDAVLTDYQIDRIIEIVKGGSDGN